jgi:hypothetical protein
MTFEIVVPELLPMVVVVVGALPDVIVDVFEMDVDPGLVVVVLLALVPLLLFVPFCTEFELLNPEPYVFV